MYTTTVILCNFQEMEPHSKLVWAPLDNEYECMMLQLNLPLVVFLVVTHLVNALPSIEGKTRDSPLR